MTSASTKNRLGAFENLESKKLMTADIGLDFGDSMEVAFGVEREMKESGEKGGTADINIGIGELQECTVSKSMEMASDKLAQLAINGNSLGTAEIDFVEVAGSGDADTKPMGWDNTVHKKWTDSSFVDDSFSFAVEREMKESGEKGGTADMNIGVGELQETAGADTVDAAIKSWSTSGDADDVPTEEVAFYYNRIPRG